MGRRRQLGLALLDLDKVQRERELSAVELVGGAVWIREFEGKHRQVLA